MFKLSFHKNNIIDDSEIKILDFNCFYCCDISLPRELEKKELENYIKYKTFKQFDIKNPDNYEVFFTKSDTMTYQVYLVEKKYFLTKKKIITTNSLLYKNISDNYFIIDIKKDSSYLLLYENGDFISENHISFGSDDCDDDKKIKDFLSFLSQITSIIKTKETNKQITEFYVHINNKKNNNLITELKNHINENIQEIDIKSIFNNYNTINLKKDRKIHKTHPKSVIVLSSMIFILSILIFEFLHLFIQNSSLQSKISSLRESYNSTSYDIRSYYTLNKTLKSKQEEETNTSSIIQSLKNQSRYYDISNIYIKIFKTIKKYDILLISIKIETINLQRFAIIKIAFKNPVQARKLLQENKSFSISKVDASKNNYEYEIRTLVSNKYD